MYQAVGVMELKSIAKGIEAADDALKSAGIRLVSAHPSCPGKYEIILTGSVSNVTAAVDHVKERFGDVIVDSCVMGRIDEQVITALYGTQVVAKQGSLGIVETYSASSAIRRRISRSKPPAWRSTNCVCPAVWAARAFSSSRARSGT